MRDKALVYLSLTLATVALAISIVGLRDAVRVKTPGDIYVSQQNQLAKAGNRWAEFHLWDAYAHGAGGVEPNPASADRWLRAFLKDIYLVRFGPAGNFRPVNPLEYLDDIHSRAPELHSDTDQIGVAAFFRTRKEGDKLTASFLTSEPDKLRATIADNPDLKFISVEPMTAQLFIEYEQSPQEDLASISDAAEYLASIGIDLGIRHQRLEIVHVVPNTPASRAGLLTGLVVQKIDGITTEGKSLYDCAMMIRGAAGSKVALEVVDAWFGHTNTVELVKAED